MSYGLVGPYPFDAKKVVACGRDALAAVSAAIRGGRGDELVDAVIPGTDPGLYVLITHDGKGGRPEIAGFWVVPSGDYTNSGPPGPPDRTPPFVQELLDAATEEVWWRNVPVRLGGKGSWRPVVVLEWPPHFASRSALAPPGVPFEDEEAMDLGLEDRETWLEAVDPQWAHARPDIPTATWDKEVDRHAHLPTQRSLVVVVRGTLKHDGRLHKGSFFMIPPALLEDGTADPLPLQEWLDRVGAMEPDDVEALEPEEEKRHHLGKPLIMPGDRIGFHSSGWLTRSLSIWPARPSDITAGSLTDRVVQQKWIAQGYLALVSSFMVIGFILSFSAAVRILTRPNPESLKPPPPPAAQPALSVCSADYQEFVEEFRCQIMHLADRDDDGGFSPVCRDAGADKSWTDDGRDLQAAFCALRDREKDGWTASLGKADRANFAAFAAAQACFNVLGHPYKYRLRELTQVEGQSGRLIGNPVAFLQDEELGIEPLVALSKELGSLCDTYGERTTARVEGAVFATHIGDPWADVPSKDSDAGALRRYLVGVAKVGMTADGEACFLRGIDQGLDAARYERMCADEADRVDSLAARNKMWTKLAGSADTSTSVVGRYAYARFAAPDTKVDDLWQCHLGLVRSEPIVPGERRAKWDLRMPIPDNYDVGGDGAKTQLVLDATLRAFDEGIVDDAGPCWKIVAKRLSNYAPIHPLLAEIDPEGWPSEEQTLCGQICAARYNLKRSVNDSAWMTRDADLALCVIKDAGPFEDDGAGHIDQLRLPWNEVRRGEWIEPDYADVCAFNVVAQNLMPPLEKGYIIQERDGKEFGGETYAGSRIVGGDAGLPARYVEGLAFGRLDAVNSAAACGHVATQCFTGLMLQVTGDKTVERYQWAERWRRKVDDLAQLKRADLAEQSPWCVGIKDYLIPARETAQFDTPCVEGVEMARANAEAAFRMLVNEGGN